MNRWDDITFDGRNRLVFDGRNQAYGAYELRTHYNRTVMFIIGGMLLFCGLLFFANRFVSQERPDELVTPSYVVEQVVFNPEPIVEPVLSPPEPPAPPQPPNDRFKFVPPVIADDPAEAETGNLQGENTDRQPGATDETGTGEELSPAVSEISGAVTVSEPFFIVEEMPEPPGGMNAFRKYLSQNIRYPEIARVAGIGGKVHLRFVVETNGSVTDVAVLRGVPGCAACDSEAVRVLRKLPFSWKPGKNNGRPARVYYNLPISFNIEN